MKKILFASVSILLLAAACSKQAQVQNGQNQQISQSALEIQIKAAVEAELAKPATPAGSRLISVKVEGDKITLDYSKEIESKGQGIAENVFEPILAKIGNIAPNITHYVILIEGQPLNEYLDNKETANWKIYTNNKYGYSIKYPAGWYVYSDDAENEVYCGGPGNKDCHGGSLQIANVANLKDYIQISLSDPPAKTPPADIAVIELGILTANSASKFTTNNFCAETSQTAISDITIGTLKGKTCSAYSTDMPSGNVKITYLNSQAYQFTFNYRPYSFVAVKQSETIKMEDAIIQTFSVK